MEKIVALLFLGFALFAAGAPVAMLKTSASSWQSFSAPDSMGVAMTLHRQRLCALLKRYERQIRRRTSISGLR